MLDRAEVAVVPGEAFGTPGYFRLSYALGDDDLVTGVTRMGEFLATARTDPGAHRHRCRITVRRSPRARRSARFGACGCTRCGADARSAHPDGQSSATTARHLPSTVCPANVAVMSTRAVRASGSSALTDRGHLDGRAVGVVGDDNGPGEPGLVLA